MSVQPSKLPRTLVPCTMPHKSKMSDTLDPGGFTQLHDRDRYIEYLLVLCT